MKKTLNAVTNHLEDVLLSIIVPVFNESAMLPIFLERVIPILKTLPLRTELIFIDDGSTDTSAEYLRQALDKYPGQKLIKLSRNFGKEAAITAGLEHAGGDAVVIMDADLQDPPEYIPIMVNTWLSGTDVVLMQRRSRAGESPFKRMSAHLFYRLLNRISQTEIPVDTGDYRLMSRRSVDALLTLKERNRYMKGLFAWVGMPTKVIRYDRAPRAAGKTKWSYCGLFGLALEGLTSFSVSPLRWAVGVGLISALTGALFGIWVVAKTVFIGDATAGYPSLIAIITFLGGIQLFSIGLVGEYVGKAYLEAKQRPVYLTEEIFESQPGYTYLEIKRKGTLQHAKAI
ncbi:glycosyltransferase family 2 protein [Microbulbifer spongiae]|uniref:Glycosyltransferase family 2 protein n=1 Tax=Microbulbifer spongiae TaxID=2944933 RepID=A0ABY9EAV9_9GAMM|nr:glycosyltransferase family 2 protein [Microbulbifer sp. MI-G]WKD48589.1 glycosyltransferase family 2 protein [Microbulbifer sp. MI-G]